LINRYARSIAVFAVLQLCCAAQPAYAQRQLLRQMDHAMWTARDGAPQVITQLGLGRDGSLWIGSESGLYNFDGRTFRLFQSPAGQAELPSGAISSLLITKGGTIWVAISEAGVARISADRVTLFTIAENEPLVSVQYLREAPDGRVWAIDRRRLMLFGADDKWHREPVPSSAAIAGIYVDSANTLWLVQDGFLYKRPLAQTLYTRTGVTADVVAGFAEAPGGDIWITDYDVASSLGRTQQVNRSGRRIRILPQFLYRNGSVVSAADGSVIVAASGAGLRRFSLEEMNQPANLRSNGGPDVFAEQHGLSSNATAALLIDQYGNIWTGGKRGLDRLRPAQLTRPLHATPDSRWTVCASEHGEVWAANTLGEIFSVTKRISPSLSSFREPLLSLACADGGYAWFVNSRGVWGVNSRGIAQLPPLTGPRRRALIKVVAASDHTLYAAVAGPNDDGGGIWRFQNKRWTKLPGEAELGAGGYGAYIDRRNRLWIGYSGGRAILHAEDGARVFPSGEPGLGHVYAFLDTSRGLFAAGTNGLARLHQSRFQMLAFEEPGLVRGVRGLVEARSGDLWLNSANGLARVAANEVERALAQPTYLMKARLLREGDFAGAPQDIAGNLDTAARDRDGRLWFVTRSGVVHLDPERTTASRPPIVSIRSMVADGQPVTDNRVVSGTRTLTIHYLGVNLTAPERVIYRYRLQGYDESWQEAGPRTEATFTRLPPGHYTFSVTASNGDGEWTEPVSLAPFTALPSFYQTWWFAAAIVGVALMAVVVIYRIRVRQIARVMNARFDERLAERTRVARELHDTLLQTVHGSKLVADRALRDTDDRARLVGALEQVSVWLGQAATEGRAALQSLRSSGPDSGDLTAAFQRAIDECQHDSEATMPFSVHGQTRELHPVVGDEIFRIGYEAIRNACHHAHATRISVTLHFGLDLTLQISDDGVGIDTGIIETGKEGHFGLRGMQERAGRIGATLTIESTPATGTSVTLVVPGRIAFRSS
jgi:signal transduction histidine kinase/ligand-binding sensor domain-containing protein